MNDSQLILRDMLADDGETTMPEWAQALGRFHRLGPRRAAAMAEEQRGGAVKEIGHEMAVVQYAKDGRVAGCGTGAKAYRFARVDSMDDPDYLQQKRQAVASSEGIRSRQYDELTVALKLGLLSEDGVTAIRALLNAGRNLDKALNLLAPGVSAGEMTDSGPA